MSAPRPDPITLDADVLVGDWPPRADLDLSSAAVRRTLGNAGVSGALVCSGRGAWFDDAAGTAEACQFAAAEPGWLPAGTVHLRNALGAETRLDALVAAGVRAVRLFGPQQGCQPDFPGYQHVITEAIRRDLLLLVEGDMRALWRAFTDRGARVVFLDVHAVHVADFVLAARHEPGFYTSTRLLNAPDSIERVAGELGPDRVVFGSRAPLYEVLPASLRLRRARLDDDAWAAVAGGTLRALLDGGSR